MKTIKAANYDFIVGTPEEIKPVYRAIERAGKKNRHSGFFPFTDPAQFNMSRAEYGILIEERDEEWPYGPTITVIADSNVIDYYEHKLPLEYPWVVADYYEEGMYEEIVEFSIDNLPLE